MKAVILAGGFGTRISEETERIPKPMVEVGGRPILWHIMKIYRAHGIREFILCLGYKSHVIKQYFVDYVNSHADLSIDFRNHKTVIHNQTEEDWVVSLVDTGLETMTGGRLKRVQSF